jgi:hypothetical protein
MAEILELFMPASLEPAMPLNRRKSAIRCLPLSDFDDSDLDAVSKAFAGAAPCALGQAWRAQSEPGFAPGQVRTGWLRDSLRLFAELTDHDIFSSATAMNQRMWELGDAFEIFLRAACRREYIEFQITPDNLRLQLRIAGTEALRHARTTDVFDAFLLPRNAFHSVTWVQPENQKWFIYAAIPAMAICGQTRLNVGSRWHFSFSRYDHTRGGSEPVISSTSPHLAADFHRQQEWGELIFATSILKP